MKNAKYAINFSKKEVKEALHDFETAYYCGYNVVDSHYMDEMLDYKTIQIISCLLKGVLKEKNNA